MHDLKGLRVEIDRCRRATDEAADATLKEQFARHAQNLMLFAGYLQKTIETRQKGDRERRISVGARNPVIDATNVIKLLGEGRAKGTAIG
jgi:hypothetical protein